MEGSKLHLQPRLPKSWVTCKLNYRYRQTPYQITISRVDDSVGSVQRSLDGEELFEETIQLVDDRRDHRIAIGLPIASG